MADDNVLMNVPVAQRIGAKVTLERPTGQLEFVALEVFFGTHPADSSTVTPFGNWPDDYDTQSRDVPAAALQTPNVVVQAIVVAKQPAAVSGNIVIAGTLSFQSASARALHTIPLRTGDRAAPGFLAWTVLP